MTDTCDDGVADFRSRVVALLPVSAWPLVSKGLWHSANVLEMGLDYVERVHARLTFAALRMAQVSYAVDEMLEEIEEQEE